MLPVVALFGVAIIVAPPRISDVGLNSRVREYVSEYSYARYAKAHHLVPSFSRQTGLACSACHYQFLSLTPFGRDFKENGYTRTKLQLVKEQTGDKAKLDLSPAPPLAVMLQTSFTHISTTVPGTQNGQAALPQQLSLFLAGQLTSKIGIFSQVTYSGADGSVGIDNIDLRYANKGQLGSTDLTYGLTLNNNPTVSDLWNTTPAWGFPYAGSDVAPTPAAGTLVDGGLAQQALGLTGYAGVGKHIYAELGLYRSALQGADTTMPSINGAAPYWRLALRKEGDATGLMVGTFGLSAKLFPTGVAGNTDKLTDVGADAQWEQQVGTGHLVTRGSWIHESRTLDATFANGGAANQTGHVQALKLNSSYYPNSLVGLTLGYFQTTGSTDATLYAAAPVEGSVNGDPKSSGVVGELDFNPWQNTRLGVQYTAYSNFNGGSTNYDGSGRNASGNNTLYFLVWVVF